MSGKFFIDTNVFVYAFDSADPAKQQVAWELIETIGSKGDCVISTQVLQEFYVVVARKLKKPLDEKTAADATEKLCAFPVVQVDKHMVLSAIRKSIENKLSLWDSLIVEAALSSDCDTLLTEDLQDGFQLGDLCIRNPFEENR